MKSLPKSLIKKASKYNKLSLEDKSKLISELYHERGYSYELIAQTCNTYKNKIRRDAIKLKIPARNKSQAQKNVLESNRAPHPTKGTKRNEETKIKISEKIAENWANLSEKDLETRKQIGRNRWDSMTEIERTEFHRKAGDAIRLTVKYGSK